MRRSVLFAAFIALSLAAGLAAAGKWPWQRRFGRDVDDRHNLSYRTIGAEVWPEEPRSPEKVDRDRFRSALGELCPPMPDERLDKWVGSVLGESQRFEVDPFLLAALMHDRSRCRPKTPDDSELYGLTRLDVKMHAPHIRGGKYEYFLLQDGEWVERHLEVKEWPFNKWKAARGPSNLYWAAAILRVWKEQRASLEKAFDCEPHRHHVSHWFYGDCVRSTEPEDRVLTIRRRLLACYHQTVPAAAGTFRGVPLVSPLDGVPRLVIDYFGNRRGKKHGPGHQGIDLSGIVGEPLRAVASGRVVFAGVDVEGAGSKRLTPEQALEMKGRRLGPGGFYVAINHDGDFRSYSMHMDTLAVHDWEEVEAGQVIGTLGRTGTASAGPHLHLEFRVGTERVDPAVPLRDVLVDPFAD
ncbi:MAG: M23 family metallopeptidase [Polyangia bacterium]